MFADEQGSVKYSNAVLSNEANLEETIGRMRAG